MNELMVNEVVIVAF